MPALYLPSTAAVFASGNALAATIDRLAMMVLFERGNRRTGKNRAFCEASKRDHAIIHDDGCGHGQIDADMDGNFNNKFTTFDHLRRKRTPFGP